MHCYGINFGVVHATLTTAWNTADLLVFQGIFYIVKRLGRFSLYLPPLCYFPLGFSGGPRSIHPRPSLEDNLPFFPSRSRADALPLAIQNTKTAFSTLNCKWSFDCQTTVCTGETLYATAQAALRAEAPDSDISPQYIQTSCSRGYTDPRRDVF